MKLYNKGLKTTFIVHLFSIPEDLFPLLTLIDWMMYLMAQKERKKERENEWEIKMLEYVWTNSIFHVHEQYFGS